MTSVGAHNTGWRPREVVSVASAPNRSSPLAVARRTNSVWRRLAPFLGTSPWGLLALAATAVLAGLLEASLLALIASVGTTLSQGAERVRMDLGPLAASASLGTTIIIGLVLAVLRGALQLLLAYLPARMSAAAMASLRQRLFDDFTKTSWSVQASERDGHFQSLMSTHVSNASQAVITIGAGISASLMFGTLLLSAFVLSVPTALAVFPQDLTHPPRSWAERTYDIARYTVMPRGGHFAPHEEPGLLAADITAFLRLLR